jgi:exodeoxyribonuclease VII large subunit
MTKVSSQWEFGDLFTAPPAPPAPPVPRRVLTVTELTTSVKRLLEQQIGRVWVTGELSNVRLQNSGHLYFCIKDGGAQLNCVLFRGEARSFNRDLLRDGVGVNVQGELTVYEARGQYQLIVSVVELQGVGALQIAFEKLKQRLHAEGLFAPERKRPLPRFPERIGIVTSPTGAAIRDVLQAVSRRHPGLKLVLAGCRVQGEGAGEEVACAIRLLNDWNDTAGLHPGRRIDLILVTRGGGSLEDLWAFNEEVVARAIVQSRIPVISGVGHEIDFTISDFVADFRAATPSAAAEIITEGFYASRVFVAEASQRLRDLAWERLKSEREELGYFVQRLQRQHPLRWLQEQWQRLDDLQNGIQRCVRYGFRNQQNAWNALCQRLWRVKPSQLLSRRREAVKLLEARVRASLDLQLTARCQRLAHASSQLRLLSPLNVLDRGYSITMDAATGRVVRSAKEVQPAQTLRTRLKEGQVESTVQQTQDPGASQ